MLRGSDDSAIDATLRRYSVISRSNWWSSAAISSTSFWRSAVTSASLFSSWAAFSVDTLRSASAARRLRSLTASVREGSCLSSSARFAAAARRAAKSSVRRSTKLAQLRRSRTFDCPRQNPAARRRQPDSLPAATTAGKTADGAFLYSLQQRNSPIRLILWWRRPRRSVQCPYSSRNGPRRSVQWSFSVETDLADRCSACFRLESASPIGAVPVFVWKVPRRSVQCLFSSGKCLADRCSACFRLEGASPIGAVSVFRLKHTSPISARSISG